jgi:DeoR/GlpR family transcriptional regulator of sugar metabolism
MAIVCYSEENVVLIKTFCEKLHRKIKYCDEQSKFGAEDLAGIADVEIIGVLTYEDVIERTLRVNINDEKDRAHAV